MSRTRFLPRQSKTPTADELKLNGQPLPHDQPITRDTTGFRIKIRKQGGSDSRGVRRPLYSTVYTYRVARA